jgi:hypothetical protein
MASALLPWQLLKGIGGNEVIVMEGKELAVPVFTRTLAPFIEQLITLGGMLLKSEDEFVKRKDFLKA